MCAPSFFCNPTNVIFAKESIAYLIRADALLNLLIIK